MCADRPSFCTFYGTPMEPAAIVTFAVICGFVWGGLLLILRTAIRREREKGVGE